MGFGNFLLPIRVISDEINLSCDLTNMNNWSEQTETINLGGQNARPSMCEPGLEAKFTRLGLDPGIHNKTRTWPGPYIFF